MNTKSICDLLPDPLKLVLLADWIDLHYPNDPNTEIQEDLRKWANNIKLLSMAIQEKCIWIGSHDMWCDMWEGSCGIAWEFTNAGPIENGCNYCPKCGKPIVCEEKEDWI